MRRKLILVMLSTLASTGVALAQSAITGTVISSDDGEPVIGATVQVIGSSVGAVTDLEGHFSVTLPKGKTQLRVSYVGMDPVDVTAKNSMKVVLTPVTKGLDEVLVVAYGTAKKSAFTGAAAVLDSKELTKTQVTNPIEAMKGKVAGVQMANGSGQPGSTSAIRIRGISSINAGNSPLIILDGAPYDGNINLINPQDIESQTILKDAASAALYGARGANGVILITTKNGRKDHTSITVDAKWGATSRQVPDYKYISNPAGYYEMWYKGLYNYAIDKMGYDANRAMGFANENLTANNAYGLMYNVYTVPEGEMLIGDNGKLNPNATLGRVVEHNGKQYTLIPDDWIDAAYRTGMRQEYSFTANASTEKSAFFGSASYLKIEGITPGSDYKRFSSRLKSDFQMYSWLKLTGNFSYAHYKVNELPDEGLGGSPNNIFAMTQLAPIYPLYLRDGNGNIIINQNTGLPAYDYGEGTELGVIRPFMKNANPLSENLINHKGGVGHNATAAGTAEVRFLEDFKFTSTNSALLGEYRGTTTNNPWFGQSAAQKGHVYKSHDRTWTYNFQQLLNWHHVFDKHDADVMIGHEYFRSHYEYLEADKMRTMSNDVTELAGAVQLGQSDSYAKDYNTEGWFGRLQYNYDNKYFGSFSYRRDASSRFDPSHRWGNFWSFGGAWLIDKEKWFDIDDVDLLKLKFSYGEQGNDNIGNYRYTTLYNIENSNGSVSLTPNLLGNSNLTWEKGGNFNAGIEFSLWKERFGGDIEYFYRKTSDMLSWFTLPGSFGFKGYWANVGDMRNSGIEIDLHGDIVRTKAIVWSLKANFTAYKNKITRLANAVKRTAMGGVEGYNSGNYFYGEGLPIYTWRMFKYAGVNKETGEALYYKDVYKVDDKGMRVKDAAGHDIVERVETTTNGGEASYYDCGTALPDAYGGFGTSLNLYGFDFSVDFSYQLGGKVYDGGYAGSMNMNRGGQIHADMEKAWTKTNPNSDIPRIMYNDVNANRFSDRFLTSGSYLCLQNITLGYTLPKQLMTRFGLESIRLYVVGDNLFLWSKRQGLDPRQNIWGGSSAVNYSQSRTISGGISLTF